jgi:hypothetical protein
MEVGSGPVWVWAYASFAPKEGRVIQSSNLMTRLLAVVAAVVLTSGCATGSDRALTFLTRDGCVNSATMRTNLDEALRALDRQTTYSVVDANALPDADPRRGYGTPTILVGRQDVFGMPEPSGPHPPPT